VQKNVIQWGGSSDHLKKAGRKKARRKRGGRGKDKGEPHILFMGLVGVIQLLNKKGGRKKSRKEEIHKEEAKRKKYLKG